MLGALLTIWFIHVSVKIKVICCGKKKLKLKHLLFSYIERVCWKDLCYYLSFDYLLMFLTSLLCKLFLILIVIKNG